MNLKVINRERDVSLRFPLQPLAWVFFGIVLIGLVAIILNARTPSQVGICLLWVLACLIAGSAVGFLFGIPKIHQNNMTAGSEGSGNLVEQKSFYQQQVNSNLTEISDWLTKIIVGLSLINLGKFPPYLNSVASTLSAAFDPKESMSALASSYAIIIGYTILGFLFGYISTRLFLAGAFSRADQEALSNLKLDIESTQAQLSSLETNQNVINQSLYSAEMSSEKYVHQMVDKTDGDNGTAAIKKLESLAMDYLAINHADLAERTRLKNNSGTSLADFALKNHINKDEILRLYEKSGNEALVLTLAIVINIKPEAGDFERLMRIAPRVSRLHVRYNVLTALNRLILVGLLHSDSDKRKAFDLLNTVYRSNADAPLVKAIDSTLSLITKLNSSVNS